MLHKLLITLGALVLPAFALAGEAGKVVFTIGSAQIAERPAVVEQTVEEGAELSTGPDGYIYLKTVDDGFLILRPNSTARIIAYRIDPANAANTQVKLELTKGVARSISGNGVKRARNNFRFNTPVAAIGVRGTDFIVYTNEQSSWVSVVSGGIVMAGFADACSPDGTGPCEGAASRELFAGRADAMLQIQSGQATPQLMQGGVVAPELNAPPRMDEPRGVSAPAVVGKHGAVALTDPNLEANTIDQFNNKNGNNAQPPVVIPKPDIVDPTPGNNGKSEILWGRWQAVARNPSTPQQIAEIEEKAKKVQLLLGSYVIGRPDSSTFVLPREGTAGYTLASSEAALGRGNDLRPATLNDGKLNIDFTNRTYATSFTVANEIGKLNLSSTGEITKDGTMVNHFVSPGVVLRGVLGGTNASEAVYTFQSKEDLSELRARGITSWSRN